MEASSIEKAKIRKWILMAVATGKATVGVTIQHIKKFLDSKQGGLSSKPEMKFILKKLLENGNLAKKDGKYFIRKSRKNVAGKETKRSKLPLKFTSRKMSNGKKLKSPSRVQKQIAKSGGSEPINQ